ncbi:hypothetical protein [Pseudaminobacter soli (ex Li et al. 2025)]|nr:hypothetical protein [Mesorhizobium soli]
MSGVDVLSDLIRAANRPDDLCNFERDKLLERAAETISDYREALNSVPTNNLGSGDIVFDLYSMAYAGNPPSHQAASEVMLRAVTDIRTLRIQMRRAHRLP